MFGNGIKTRFVTLALTLWFAATPAMSQEIKRVVPDKTPKQVLLGLGGLGLLATAIAGASTARASSAGVSGGATTSGGTVLSDAARVGAVTIITSSGSATSTPSTTSGQ